MPKLIVEYDKGHTQKITTTWANYWQQSSWGVFLLVLIFLLHYMFGELIGMDPWQYLHLGMHKSTVQFKKKSCFKIAGCCLNKKKSRFTFQLSPRAKCLVPICCCYIRERYHKSYFALLLLFNCVHLEAKCWSNLKQLPMKKFGTYSMERKTVQFLPAGSVKTIFLKISTVFTWNSEHEYHQRASQSP